MKKVLLVISLLAILGCSGGKKTDGRCQISDSIWFVGEIDSCEYVFIFNRMAHKGNCKFCKERNRKEKKQLMVELKNLMSELRETDLLFMEEE